MCRSVPVKESWYKVPCRSYYVNKVRSWCSSGPVKEIGALCLSFLKNEAWPCASKAQLRSFVAVGAK